MHYLKNYSEISRPPSLRASLRNLAVEAASWLPRRGMERPRVHFLYLHHVLDDEFENFGELLDLLAKEHTFLTHSEAVNRVREGVIDKPYISISIDDGLKNCLRIAEQLEQREARGCFFVCPSMADNPSYELANEFCNRQLSLPAAEFLNWSDMELLLRRGHEIGNHTFGHLTLSQLGRDQLEEQICRSREMLAAKLGGADHFAWPRGTWRHISQEAVDLVFGSGHLSCASAVRGAHVAGCNSRDALCIRRDHIVAAWPLRQCLFFISQSARNAKASNNDFVWQ